MSTHRRLRAAAVVLAAGCWLFPAVSPIQAQTATGNINGYVRDTTGAIVPNASVTAKMTEQQFVRTAETNAEGFYQLLALPPGTYDVTVEAKGFQRQTQTGLQLTVNQNLRVDASLQVGAVETQVTIDAAAPLVDTTSATMSGLIDDRRVVDLPLNGRNVIGLARILPGVLNVNAPQQMSDARGGPGMNVNGGRSNMNLFTLNGGYFNNPSRNTGMNFPPPDAVQEVRILTHNFAAEYGRNPGSQVNVVSRAGTNQFHGSAWEFLRNDAMNARNFFSARVPELKQNQFGVAAGGPVIEIRFSSSAHIRACVTAARRRRCRRSCRPQHSGPAISRPPGVTLTNAIDPITKRPFTDAAGNPCVRETASRRLHQPGRDEASSFVPTSPSGEINSLAASPRDGDQYMFRGDWNQSERHRIYASWFEDRNTRSSAVLLAATFPATSARTSIRRRSSCP